MTDEQIFDRAIRLEGNSRLAFLREACGEDSQQHQRIAALVASHEQGDSLLDTQAMAGDSETVINVTPRKTIGDFEIVGELGRGGMGVVYEARQKSLRRKVALKVLSSGLGLSSKAILRFRREAEAAGKLHHTNIVPIYTTGEDKGIHYYAMELIDGPSLDAVVRALLSEPESGSEPAVRSSRESDLPDWVRETALFEGPGGNRRPSVTTSTGDGSVASSARSTIASGSGYFDQVATMIADVADALDHAHEHGVVHRDIKPSNLLLGPDGRLSINDFGLARMLEQPGMTMSGEFVGSPLYMSPEQITAGRVAIDHRTDIYSLGATLYELLALRPPFPGQTRDQVLSQILHKEPVSTRKLNRRIPIDLDTICMKAIDKDPDRRYQTAGALAEDLRRYVHRHAISARRIGPVGMTIKYAKRNPVTVTFAVFVALTIVAGGFLHQLRKVERREYREEALRQKVEHREQQRKVDISALSEDILDDIFRGQVDNTPAYINQAEDLGATQEWLAFHRGLRQLFQQDYGDATVELERVLELNPDNTAAKALLAVAQMWSGCEYESFRLLSEILPKNALTFEDKFFLGYAHHWGNAALSYRLLNEANVKRPNLQYVIFLRGVAARVRASADFNQIGPKKKYIDLAITDLEIPNDLMPETPLKLKELSIAYLHRANIYERFARIDSESRASHQATVVRSRENAMEMLPKLRETETSSDSQYAAVMLLSEIGTPDKLREMADSWEQKEIGSIYAAQFLAIKFASLGKYHPADHERANYWLSRAMRIAKGRDILNVETFVKIVDPNRSGTLQELFDQTRDRINGRRDSGETENIQFDVQSALLFGDKSQRKLYVIDRLDDVIQGGAVFKPIRDYISQTNGDGVDSERLIEMCASTPSPNASLMHAHFFLGVEAIADGREEDAVRHLTACREGKEFMFVVYFLSELLLNHKDQWNSWNAVGELLSSAHD